MQCASLGCPKRPSHNYPTLPPYYCNEHYVLGMVLLSATCKHYGCPKRSAFNLPGLAARYCRLHRKTGMIMTCRTCIAEGCGTSSSFNLVGLTARYCSTHKRPRMTNVLAPQCSLPACTKQASYGHRGARKKRLYCAEHKSPEMIHAQQNRSRTIQRRRAKLARLPNLTATNAILIPLLPRLSLPLPPPLPLPFPPPLQLLSLPLPLPSLRQPQLGQPWPWAPWNRARLTSLRHSGRSTRFFQSTPPEPLRTPLGCLWPMLSDRPPALRPSEEYGFEARKPNRFGLATSVMQSSF